MAAVFAEDEPSPVFHDADVVDAGMRPIGALAQRGDGPERAAATERSPWLNVPGVSLVFPREMLASWPLRPCGARPDRTAARADSPR